MIKAEYRELTENDLSDIVFFIKQYQNNSNYFVSQAWPVLTLPILRHLIFNDTLYLYGEIKNGEINSLAMFMYPNPETVSTSVDLLFCTIDKEFIKKAHEQLVSNKNALWSKTKVTISEEQTERGQVDKLIDAGFIFEMNFKQNISKKQMNILSYYLV